MRQNTVSQIGTISAYPPFILIQFIVIMKLCIDDEDDRPDYLTDNFFINFMITQTKRKATLQIVQFHKKKQLTYSTKMSDGYFIVKVMVIQKAAEQLENGQIQVNYVVEGMLKNHGEGVIMIRDPLKIWKYSSKIGNPINWRLNKQNVNSKGHGFIVWNSQQLYDLHEGEQQVKGAKQRQVGQKNQQQKQEKHRQNHEEKKEQQKQKTQNNKEKSKSNRGQQQNTAKIQEAQPRREQPYIVATSTSSLTETQSIDHNRSIKPVEKEPIFDLKFVFDFFEQEDAQNQRNKTQTQPPPAINHPQPTQQNQQSSDQDFTNWLQSKKNRELQNNPPKEKQSQSQVKRLQKYKLMLQSDSDKQENSNTMASVSSKQESLLRPMLTNKVKDIPREQDPVDSKYIEFSDIYHGLYTRSTTNWWTKAVVCCLGPLTQKDSASVILTDEGGYYIMNAVFTNFSFMKVELIENKLYRLSNGLIRVNVEEMSRNVSHCELYFDCKKAAIYEMQSDQTVTYRAQNYTLLNKLYELQDGVPVNTFGVIKSIRNTGGKNGTMSHYQIIDPIIRYSIAFTQFDSHLQEEELPPLVNTPITIYNAYTGSFRGRKNIVSRYKTIVKYNWLPLLKETDLIWRWLEDDSNQLESIDLNLVGYVECSSLDLIDSVAEGRVFVKNVTVLDINDKFTYLGCVKCYKKVEDGRCRTCGKRNSKETIERLLVRGNIGDCKNVVSVLWSNSLGQTILRQGMPAFKRRWELKKVTVWLQRGSNDCYTIVKVQEIQSKNRIKQLLQYVHRNIL